MHLETSEASMTFQAFEAAMEALHLSRQVSYRRGAEWGGLGRANSMGTWCSWDALHGYNDDSWEVEGISVQFGN